MSLAFVVDEDAKCVNQQEGQRVHEFVLRCNVPRFPRICIVCLMRTLDEPMEWKLSNMAIQTLAHRAHASEIHAEEKRLEQILPPELRSRKKR